MSKIKIILVGLSLIGISVGMGYALQQKSENITNGETTDVLTAGSATSSTCQCEVQKSDLLTRDDVFKIFNDNRIALKGDRGEKGDKGDTVVGPTGMTGLQGDKGNKGDKGDKGDTPPGNFVRYCIDHTSPKQIYPYPVDIQEWSGVTDSNGQKIYYDQCEGGRKIGKKVYFWTQ